MAQNVAEPIMPSSFTSSWDRYYAPTQSQRYEESTSYTLRPKMLHHMDPLTPLYSHAPRTVRKGSYPLVPSGQYGLTPSADYMASLGSYGLALPWGWNKGPSVEEVRQQEEAERKEKTRKIITWAVADALVVFLVGPRVLRTFAPQLPYKKRLQYSAVATFGLSFIARHFFGVNRYET